MSTNKRKTKNTTKKLRDVIHDVARRKHLSIRTEKSYVAWIKQCLYFNNIKHPANMGNREIEEFLTHLAKNKNASASSKNPVFITKKLFFFIRPPSSILKYSQNF